MKSVLSIIFSDITMPLPVSHRDIMCKPTSYGLAARHP